MPTPEQSGSSPSSPILEKNPHCALIMKGGGILGLAYVGALEVLSDHYSFNWYIGTSAGAISAILFASGYSNKEMLNILRQKDFNDFFDAKWWQKPFNLFFYYGFNHAHTFRKWINNLLADKFESATPVTLQRIAKETNNRIIVYACRRETSAIVFDSASAADTYAAYAARCSMSIPIVFVPQQEQGFRTYDGGIKLNFPIERFTSENPGSPFIALYLGSERYEEVEDRSFLSVIYDVLNIARGASSEGEVVEEYKNHVVVIDPRPIGWLDFNLTDDEKDYLLACGRTAAHKHLNKDSPEYAAATLVRDSLKKKIEAARSERRQEGVHFRNLWLSRLIWAIVIIALFSVVGGFALSFGYRPITLEVTPQKLIASLEEDRKHNALNKWTPANNEPLIVVTTTLSGAEESNDPTPHSTIRFESSSECGIGANWISQIDFEWQSDYKKPATISGQSVRIQGKMSRILPIKSYCPHKKPNPSQPDGYVWAVNIVNCIIVQ